LTILNCKSCGAPLRVEENSSTVTCPFCENVYCIPRSEQQKKILNLFSKADEAWGAWDFEEAAKYYQEILDIDNQQADAHFGLVLCKYGIAYETDPQSKKIKPSCNRINRDSVLNDKHYLSAIRYASKESAELFKERAREIDRITSDYLAIVDKESPYDVFISYKKTGEHGKNTEDTKIARNVYFQLKEMGFKVFFAEETLKSIGGQKFEPYIFAALSSATVMVLVGSKPEYLESTWVKNEWRRFCSFKNEDDNKDHAT